MQCHGTQSMFTTDLNRPLMREILDKLEEGKEGMSELLIYSATDESEANSPIKSTQRGSRIPVQNSKRNDAVKNIDDKIIDTKKKLCNKVRLRKTGKTKVDSELSAKAVNSAKRKRVQGVMDMGQGDD